MKTPALVITWLLSRQYRAKQNAACSVHMTRAVGLGCGNVKTIFIGKSCVHITVELFELHVSSDGPYARYPLLPFITKDKVTPKIKDIAFLITMCLFSVRDINVCVNLSCTKKYYIEKYTSYTMMIRTFC